MPPRWTFLLPTVGWLVACGSRGGSESAPADAAPPTPVDVPLAVTEVASDGSMRFSIPIQVGDSDPVDVLFDTGSTGLVILEGTVPTSAFSDVSTEKADVVYGGGLQLSGVYAWTTVTIGGLTTPYPVPVLLVTSVGCAASNPTCSGAGKTPADATLFGPWRAIFGAGMYSAGSYADPIAELPGHPAYVVKAPAYGGTTGTLRIGPTSEELATFKTYPLTRYGDAGPVDGLVPYDDGASIPACVTDTTAGATYCEPVLLDSGNSTSVVFWADGLTKELSSGDAVQVTIGPAGAPLAQYGFTVGHIPVPGVDQVLVENAAVGHMNLGVSVYFRYDVLWDQANGRIGLAPH